MFIFKFFLKLGGQTQVCEIYIFSPDGMGSSLLFGEEDLNLLFLKY